MQAAGESSCSSLLTRMGSERPKVPPPLPPQKKLPALAVRFLRTGSARLSEPIGGRVSEGNSYCFF